MATPTISVTATVGAIYTKDYGTVKFDWTISNPDGYELKSVTIVRAAASGSIFATGKTVTLNAGLGFNPIDTTGSWTDTGLALTKDYAGSDNDTTYTFTLTYVNDAGADAPHTPADITVTIPRIDATVTSPLDDYCTTGCWDFMTKKAYATFEGKAALASDNGTTITLINADGMDDTSGTSVTFITHSGTSYSATSGLVQTSGAEKYVRIGTGSITTDAHATEALHNAFAAAIASSGDVDLKSTLTPSSYTNETSITLTQDTAGEWGNTFIKGTMDPDSLSVNGLKYIKNSGSGESAQGDGGRAVYSHFTGGRIGSDLSIWMEEYFENPISGQSSFDIKYCLNDPNAKGVGDVELYFGLPQGASVTSFVPNTISTASAIAASPNSAALDNRWKVSIASPTSGGTLDFGHGTPGNAVQSYAVFEGKAAFDDDNGTTITIHNADTKAPVTFTTSSSTAVDKGTATTIGTDGASSDTLATKALYYAFSAAIRDGLLSATLTPKNWVDGDTEFRLTQDAYGSIGNIAFTHTGTQIVAANININGDVFTSGVSTFIDGGATGVKASATDVLFLASASADDAFTAFVPSSSGGIGQTTTIVSKSSLSGTPGGETIWVLTSGGDTTDQDNLVLAINGTTDTAKVKYGAGLTNTDGVKGLTAENGTGLFVSLEATTAGYSGNLITITDSVGSSIVQESTLSNNKLTGGVSETGGNASAVFAGLTGLEDSGGSGPDGQKALSLINSDGTTVSFRLSSSLTETQSTSSAIGTSGTDTAAKATKSLHTAFSAAIAEGLLKAKLTPHVHDTETSITLTQLSLGTSGNTKMYGVAASTDFNVGGSGFTSGTSAFASGTDPAPSDTNADADLLPPTYGRIGTVYIDKPVGDDIICFDTANSRVEIVDANDNRLLFEGKGNLNNKDNKIQHIRDQGYSYIPRESTDYYWLPINTQLSPSNIWQTGPCLTKGTSQTNIGYGDYSYKVEAFDSNTFDIKHCLVKDEIDTFIIVCAMTDFQTQIASIDEEFGEAVGADWVVNFKNLSPGFSIIYGNGNKKIKPSGLQTLLRVYLDRPLIQQNSETDPNKCVCTFPAFLKLEENYDNFVQFIEDAAEDSLKNIDTDAGAAKSLVNSIGSLWDYEIGDFTYQTGEEVTSSSDYQEGSGIITELLLLASKGDPRFAEGASCVAKNIERVLKQEPPGARLDGLDYNIIKKNAIAAGHYYRIFIMGFMTLVGKLPALQDRLDFTWQKLKNDAEALCSFGLAVDSALPHSSGRDCFAEYFTTDVDGNDVENKEFVVHIYSNNLFDATSGIQVDFTNLKAFLDATDSGEANEEGVTIVDANSWGKKKYKDYNLKGYSGRVDQDTILLHDKNYIQAYSANSGRFLAVYNSKITETNSQSGYLVRKWDELSHENQILTTMVFDFSSVSGGTAGSAADALRVALNTAIKKDLESAIFLSNEVVSRPRVGWTGSSYATGGGDSVGIKDFFTTLMFALEGSGIAPATHLTPSYIESVIKLPKDAIGDDGTHKDLFGQGGYYSSVSSFEASRNSYPTEGSDAIKLIDANDDEYIDIVDLVTLRNLFVAKNTHPDTSPKNNSSLALVPTVKCTAFDFNVDFLLPTNCSTFCVVPTCFAKIWISDFGEVEADRGVIEYMAEISCSVDCADDAGNIIKDISGIQFKIEGLKGDGIRRVEHGHKAKIYAADGVTLIPTQTAIGADPAWQQALVGSQTHITGDWQHCDAESTSNLTKDTYFAYSAGGQVNDNDSYINKGKQVLCYLIIPTGSMPTNMDLAEMANVYLNTTTNNSPKIYKFLGSGDAVEPMKLLYPKEEPNYQLVETDSKYSIERASKWNSSNKNVPELVAYYQMGNSHMSYEMEHSANMGVINFYSEALEGYIDGMALFGGDQTVRTAAETRAAGWMPGLGVSEIEPLSGDYHGGSTGAWLRHQMEYKYEFNMACGYEEYSKGYMHNTALRPMEFGEPDKLDLEREAHWSSATGTAKVFDYDIYTGQIMNWKYHKRKNGLAWEFATEFLPQGHQFDSERNIVEDAPNALWGSHAQWVSYLNYNPDPAGIEKWNNLTKKKQIPKTANPYFVGGGAGLNDTVDQEMMMVKGREQWLSSALTPNISSDHFKLSESKNSYGESKGFPVGHATTPSSSTDWGIDHNFDRWENSFLVSFWVKVEQDQINKLKKGGIRKQGAAWPRPDYPAVDMSIGCFTMYQENDQLAETSVPDESSVPWKFIPSNIFGLTDDVIREIYPEIQTKDDVYNLMVDNSWVFKGNYDEGPKQMGWGYEYPNGGGPHSGAGGFGAIYRTLRPWKFISKGSVVNTWINNASKTAVKALSDNAHRRFGKSSEVADNKPAAPLTNLESKTLKWGNEIEEFTLKELGEFAAYLYGDSSLNLAVDMGEHGNTQALEWADKITNSGSNLWKERDIHFFPKGVIEQANFYLADGQDEQKRACWVDTLGNKVYFNITPYRPDECKIGKKQLTDIELDWIRRMRQKAEMHSLSLRHWEANVVARPDENFTRPQWQDVHIGNQFGDGETLSHEEALDFEYLKSLAADNVVTCTGGKSFMDELSPEGNQVRQMNHGWNHIAILYVGGSDDANTTMGYDAQHHRAFLWLNNELISSEVPADLKASYTGVHANHATNGTLHQGISRVGGRRITSFCGLTPGSFTFGKCDGTALDEGYFGDSSNRISSPDHAWKDRMDGAGLSYTMPSAILPGKLTDLAIIQGGEIGLEQYQDNVFDMFYTSDTSKTKWNWLFDNTKTFASYHRMKSSLITELYNMSRGNWIANTNKNKDIISQYNNVNDAFKNWREGFSDMESSKKVYAKNEASLNMDVVEKNAIEGAYPLSNIRFKSWHTDELSIFDMFGIRVSNAKVTSNRKYNTSTKAYSYATTQADSTWLGYDSGGGAPTITDENMSKVLTLAASGLYDVSYDSNNSGVIDITDIQALGHLKYGSKFNFATNYVVPKDCCPTVAPDIPNLKLIDYKDGNTTVALSGSKNIIDVSVDGGQFGCSSAKSNQGGVFLQWDPVDNADYYIVYRLEPGEGKAAVPIIATNLEGTLESAKDFNERDRSNRTPVQITPTTWIDYPPPLPPKTCLEYDSSDNDFDDQLSNYKYWVEAVNKKYTVKSNEPIGYTVNCKYKPTFSTFSFSLKPTRTTYHGDFRPLHPFVSATMTNPLAGSDDLKIWTYVKGYAGSEGRSEKGGTVITDGSSPTSSEGAANSFGFQYTPPKDFVGKDKITYTAKVEDPDNRFNIAEWCEASEDIIVRVLPKTPVLSVNAGSCCNANTKGKVTLTWKESIGAEIYELWFYDTTVVPNAWAPVRKKYPNGAKVEIEPKDHTRKDDVDADGINNFKGTREYSFVEEPKAWSSFNTNCDSTDTLNVKYKLKAAAPKAVGGYSGHKTDSNEATASFDCCSYLANPAISSTSSSADNCTDSTSNPTHTVQGTFPLISTATHYKVFRRKYGEDSNGGFTDTSSKGDWVELDEHITVPPPPATTATFYDNGVAGVVGCSSIKTAYDYFVISATSCGHDPEAIANLQPAPTMVELDGCSIAPRVSDAQKNTKFQTPISINLNDYTDINGTNTTISTWSEPTITSGSSIGTISNFVAAAGTFDFIPAQSKTGTVTMTWTATNNCTPSATSSVATLKIKVMGSWLTRICNEENYDTYSEICNYWLNPELSDQQDISNIRQKISTLIQVPFMFNIKGAPSLRNSRKAYTVTRGFNPYILAPAGDDKWGPTSDNGDDDDDDSGNGGSGDGTAYSALFHFNTNYNDSCVNSITPTNFGTGTSTISTSEKKFGAASLYTDGTSGILIPDTTGVTDLGWDGSTVGVMEDCTIDFFARIDSTNATGENIFLIGGADTHSPTGGTSGQWFLAWQNTANAANSQLELHRDTPAGTGWWERIGSYMWRYGPNAPGSSVSFADTSQSGGAYSTLYDTWHHFAIEIKDNNFHIYMNGRRVVGQANGTITSWNGFDAGGIAVGHPGCSNTSGSTGTGEAKAGKVHIDELRIIKGEAKYAPLEPAATGIADGSYSADQNSLEVTFTPPTGSYTC